MEMFWKIYEVNNLFDRLQAVEDRYERLNELLSDGDH
jgi:hypothetical protein